MMFQSQAAIVTVPIRDVVLNVAPRGVLLNDSDADGDILSAAVATGPAHGTLVLNADGSFQYTPTPGYSGTDSFTYRASDALSSSAATTVTLTVLPFVPRAKFFVVDADRAASFQYLADGSSLSNNALNKSDSKPRGIASNPTGTIQWVIDVSGAVFIYDNTGAFLGQWTPLNVGKPEGIAVWGNDLWLVDPNSDKVFKFTGGAARRSGKSRRHFQLCVGLRQPEFHGHRHGRSSLVGSERHARR
jgi:VCBS repeat-containing protein